jgi:hypothetical protein
MAPNKLLTRPSPLTSDELHPLVYRSIIGLTVWLVLSVWVLFNRGTYEGVTLSRHHAFLHHSGRNSLTSLADLAAQQRRRRRAGRHRTFRRMDLAYIRNLDRGHQRARSINSNSVADRRRSDRHDGFRPGVYACRAESVVTGRT